MILDDVVENWLRRIYIGNGENLPTFVENDAAPADMCVACGQTFYRHLMWNERRYCPPHAGPFADQARTS